MVKATLRAADIEQQTAVPQDDHITVTDTKGRTIKLRTLSVLEEMRLLKMLGEFNRSYYAFAAQVARVCEIGGAAVMPPNSERQIEAIASRLDKEGVAAILGDDASDKVDSETDRNRVKN